MSITRCVYNGYTKIQLNAPETLCECHVDDKNLKAIFYAKKQAKCRWHYKFKTLEQMMQKINTSVKNILDNDQINRDWKQKAKETYAKELASMKVGDIYVNSWGYDQTNIDFYQVTRITGKVFYVREIESKLITREGYADMSGFSVPVKDQFKGEEIKKTSLTSKHGVFYKTSETEEHYTSWYA